MTVENPYRVGKTQWSKWNDAGRVAYNEAREAGATYAEGLEAAKYATKEAENTRQNGKRKKNIFDRLEDAAEIAIDVAEVAETVVPVLSTVRAVREVTRKRKNS